MVSIYKPLSSLIAGLPVAIEPVPIPIFRARRFGRVPSGASASFTRCSHVAKYEIATEC
ncbi:hypothetical protein LUTEI9C_120019 [Luteimonas sp. 9C]|nr:hypothetical protein LUTEI9C_120019 [Luteimonas sp. 9C]